jgi:hypothetical protein
MVGALHLDGQFGPFLLAKVIALGSSFRLSDMHAKIMFWFSDTDITRSICLWGSEGNLLMTTHHALHDSDPLRKMTPEVFFHVEVGVCTDGQWSIYYYLKSPMTFDLVASFAAFRDLTSVLDPKVNGIPCTAPGVNLDAAR